MTPGKPVKGVKNDAESESGLGWAAVRVENALFWLLLLYRGSGVAGNRTEVASTTLVLFQNIFAPRGVGGCECVYTTRCTARLGCGDRNVVLTRKNENEQHDKQTRARLCFFLCVARQKTFRPPSGGTGMWQHSRQGIVNGFVGGIHPQTRSQCHPPPLLSTASKMSIPQKY